ncbi:DUF1127 domain-containing protein [Marivibrio halodurans]|uniref:DUF1127 domain-containing protein n=1 Tax=Marivibrio halodurans TaxID=2039722 RepID=A0A8J7SN82_9PROT|nr:DUF1127 domain-containing protein [Marivibrio halodurans]MBP5857853.1 DUF1127 domain-containing protein [Marivibrio halodurans]
MSTQSFMSKPAYSFGGTVTNGMGPLSLLALWQRRREEREALRDLPDFLIADLGLTHEQVRAEVEKPFWRA